MSRDPAQETVWESEVIPKSYMLTGTDFLERGSITAIQFDTTWIIYCLRENLSIRIIYCDLNYCISMSQASIFRRMMIDSEKTTIQGIIQGGVRDRTGYSVFLLSEKLQWTSRRKHSFDYDPSPQRRPVDTPPQMFVYVWSVCLHRCCWPKT